MFGLEIMATYPMAHFGDGGDFNQFWRTFNSTKQAMLGYGGWVCILNIMQVLINDQKP